MLSDPFLPNLYDVCYGYISFERYSRYTCQYSADLLRNAFLSINPGKVLRRIGIRIPVMLSYAVDVKSVAQIFCIE